MTPSRLTRSFVWLTLAAFTSANVLGAPVDLADVPLVSMSTKVVRPNVLFILDDSGSMNDAHMPDSANQTGRLCYRNFGYNKIYFNPAVTYALPKQSNGTDYGYNPTPGVTTNYTVVRPNGYAAGSEVNLTALTAINTPTVASMGPTGLIASNSFVTTFGSPSVRINLTAAVPANLIVGSTVRFTGLTGGTNSNTRWNNVRLNNRDFTVTAVGANYFTFNANDNANSAVATNVGNNATGQYTYIVTTYESTYNYTTHATNPSTCGLDATYTKVGFNSMSAAEQQNFAIWFSFYRTRMLMMKSAVGRAFVGVDDNFRVGFTTINERGTGATRWLGNSSFGTTQKSNWYTRLYGTTGGSYTPLRGALSKAGRYYAGTLVTGNNDPVQYSCQKNFSILTTDGYWNLDGESTTPGALYGPYREDNTTPVGDQDGDESTSPRPQFDSGAHANTLADVARYYYRTDLRTTTALGGLRDDGSRTAVSANIQDEDGVDLPDGHQHMKTITLSLGLSGQLTFPTAITGLTDGSLNWPDPDVTNASTSGFPSRLDDLWHASINGDGVHLSASDAEDVVDALRTALATISDQNLSGAAAATSSLEPVAGDNFAYVAEYTTARWHGDLEARTIDLATGRISTTAEWSAQSLLNGDVSASSDSRNIYTSNAAGTARVDFTLANVNAAHFSGTQLSQYAALNATQQANASAANMINFLRGQHEFESRTDDTHTDLNKRVFRTRSHVLGDIVDSSPVYVKKPPFRYADSGYAAYVGAQQTRGGTVYVGANDGMLHAFDAETGEERWAYVPRMLHPQLYRLADTNYASNHRYYVNGSITVGDAFDGSTWRTILIAGLAGGGKGFFALDITDPSNPSLLWEYTNANLGYTYGNPVLTKRALDGSWVVLFASGYQKLNATDTSDGQGRLFMLNAFTGASLGSIATAAGTNPNVSGIAKITNWVLDTLVDNSTQYVYGGDLGGNLWRFDISNMAVQKLGQTAATTGARPITARPEVARIRDAAGTYHRVVYVGTGRYLGGGDVAGGSTPETTEQLLLAVKDTGSDLGDLSASGAALVEQDLTFAPDANGDGREDSPRTIAATNPVDWTAGNDNGWFVAIPLGERVTIEPKLQLGTVSFVANKPVDDYCALGGSSWLYALDFRSGGAISTQNSTNVGFQVDDQTIGTGLTIIRLPDGTLVALVNTPDGTKTQELPTMAAGAGTVRRVGYREIN